MVEQLLLTAVLDISRLAGESRVPASEGVATGGTARGHGDHSSTSTSSFKIIHGHTSTTPAEESQGVDR